jgi:hypothetical protein
MGEIKMSGMPRKWKDVIKKESLSYLDAKIFIGTSDGDYKNGAMVWAKRCWEMMEALNKVISSYDFTCAYHGEKADKALKQALEKLDKEVRGE